VKKYKNVFVFQTQNRIFRQSFTILKTVYKRWVVIDFWRLLCPGKYLNLFIRFEKQVSHYKEQHFVELEILHLLVFKRIIFVSPNFEKIATDKYDSVGRGCLLDVLHFSKEKQFSI
jgi:hypothetical protein